MATITVRNAEVVKTVHGNSPFTLSFPEAALQTFKKGAVLTFNGAGYVVEATSPDPPRIIGFAAEDGHNGATAGLYNASIHVADMETIMVMNCNSTTTLLDRGRGYGVVKSGDNWVVDKAGDPTGAALADKRVTVMDLDPRDAVGDTNGRMHVMVVAQYRALSSTS